MKRTAAHLLLAAAAFAAAHHLSAPTPSTTAPHTPRATAAPPPARAPLPTPATLADDTIAALASLAPFTRPQPASSFTTFVTATPAPTTVGDYHRRFALLASLSALLDADPLAFLEALRPFDRSFSPIEFFIPADATDGARSAIFKIVRSATPPTLTEAQSLRRLLRGHAPDTIPALAPPPVADPVGEILAAREAGTRVPRDLFERWVAQDGAGAWETALDTAAFVGDDKTMVSLMFALLQHDAEAALQILNDPDRSGIGHDSRTRGIPGLGTQGAIDLAMEIGERLPEQALDWALASIPNRDALDVAIPEIASPLGHTHPHLGTAFFAGDPPISVGARRHAMGYLAYSWAAHDPAAALGWALSQTGEERTHTVFKVLQRASPEVAFPALEALAESDPKIVEYVLDSRGKTLGQYDLARLVKLVGDDHQKILPVLTAAEVSNGNHTAAAALLDSHGFTSHDAVRAAESLARAWAQAAPADAATWVLSLPDDRQTRIYASRILIDIWTRDAPGDAVAWFTALPDGAIDDAAYLQVIEKVAPYDLGAAFGLATKLGEDHTRHSFVRQNATALAALAPDAARAFIETHITDESDRRRSTEALASEQAWLDHLRNAPAR